MEIELDDSVAPITVRAIVDSLPLSICAHVWGQEIYTDPISIQVSEENSKSLVNLHDVAYWASWTSYLSILWTDSNWEQG